MHLDLRRLAAAVAALALLPAACRKEEDDRRLGGKSVQEVTVAKDFDPELAWKGEAAGHASYAFFDEYWASSSDVAAKVLGRGHHVCVLRIETSAAVDDPARAPRAGTAYAVKRVLVHSEALTGTKGAPTADLDALAHRNAVQLDLEEKGAREPRGAMLKCLGLPRDKVPDAELVNRVMGGKLVLKVEGAPGA